MRLDLGQPPLRDADYTRIRATVLAKVRHRDRVDNVWRLAFAMIIAAFSYVAFRPVENVAAPAAGHSTKIVIATTTHVETPASGVVIASAAEAAAATPASRVHPRATLAKKTIPQPMRIEIQTADPDVRIIWITDNSVEDSQS